MNPSLHLVIPARNESARLPSFLSALCERLSSASFSTALRVIDDGSDFAEMEAMQDAVESLRVRFPFLCPMHSLPHNQGKGAAIRAGWKLLTPVAFQGFVDADGAISPEEVIRLTETAFQQSSDISWCASRIRMLGRKIQRSELRHYSGRFFASLVGNWIDSGVYDSQCGFKLISVVAWDKIAPVLEETGFVFDVELIAQLRQHGFPIKEFPIDWTDQPGSKVNLWRDAWRMAAGLRRIRRRLHR